MCWVGNWSLWRELEVAGSANVADGGGRSASSSEALNRAHLPARCLRVLMEAATEVTRSMMASLSPSASLAPNF